MKKLLTIATGLSIVIAAVMLHQPARARTFISASRNSNANTDFAVPTGVRFSSYIAQMTPENNSRYQADVYLKYNDGTSSQAVSRPVEARRFYLYNQPFRTPTGRQPFQINTRIKGSRNTAYRVSVLACQ